MTQLTEDLRYRIFKLLEVNPNMSQRSLAEELGISLGKLNYCVKALAEKGWVKARNFKNSRNKLAYAYIVTPAGLEEKARMTVKFLRIKIAEVESLKAEIAVMQQRAKADDEASDAKSADAAQEV